MAKKEDIGKYCCKEDFCLLDKLYPNGDNATYACDSDCYLSYSTNTSGDRYKEKYPEYFKNIEENGTSINK